MVTKVVVVVSMAGALCFGRWIFLLSHFPGLREPRCTGGENFGTPAPLSGKKRGRLVGTCVRVPNVATSDDTLVCPALFTLGTMVAEARPSRP